MAKGSRHWLTGALAATSLLAVACESSGSAEVAELDGVATTAVPVTVDTTPLDASGRPIVRDGDLAVPGRLQPAYVDDPQAALRTLVASMRAIGISLDHLTDQQIVEMAAITCYFFDTDAPPPLESNISIMRLIAGQIVFERVPAVDGEGIMEVMLRQFLAGVTSTDLDTEIGLAVNELGSQAVKYFCPEHAVLLER